MEKEASREALVAVLRERGVAYLAPSDARLNGESALTARELIARLAAQDDARLRLALIPLFIRHPDLAQAVPLAVAMLTDPARTEAIACYMAAVYLQHLWSIRLGFYLPELSFLPDWFSGEIGLPLLDERHGKVGLHALADWHAAHSPYPFNWLASYQRVMDQLFEQLKQEARRREYAPGDFIPLPSGYQERSRFIARYGQLDVFHFDLYSTALSKIERGTAEDFSDVVALLQNEQIEMSALEASFAEILPRFATASLKRDPDEFQKKFAALKQMWRQVHL